MIELYVSLVNDYHYTTLLRLFLVRSSHQKQRDLDENGIHREGSTQKPMRVFNFLPLRQFHISFRSGWSSTRLENITFF